MKIIKPLLVVSAIACLMSGAQAATTYAVSGVLVATNLTAFLSYDPAFPTFSGITTIDEQGGIVESSLIFAPYTIHFGQGYVYRPNHTVSFSGGVSSWVDNTLTISGLTSTETSTGDVYVDMSPLPPADDIESGMVVTFSDATHFTGMSFDQRHSQGLTLWSNYSITGIAVPVPAAAWLFGSGLFGLAGASRRWG